MSLGYWTQGGLHCGCFSFGIFATWGKGCLYCDLPFWIYLFTSFVRFFKRAFPRHDTKMGEAAVLQFLERMATALVALL